MKSNARAIAEKTNRKLIALPLVKDDCGYQLVPQLWFGLGVAAILVQFVERGQLNPMPATALTGCGRCGHELQAEGLQTAVDINHLDQLERATYIEALTAGLEPLGLLVEFHPGSTLHTCEGAKETPAHVVITIGPASPERLGGGLPTSSIEDL